MSRAPIVDPEFKALLPALTPDQREGLERAILADGILTPLVVWEEAGVLLDGHNRLEIAEREGVPFATRAVKLASREAAIEWIFANQRDRRNLTPDQLALVMGRHFNKAKKPGGKAWRSDLPQKDAGEGSTRDRLATVYGVSTATIERNGKLASAVETLKAVDPEIEQKVISGKGSTRKAVIAAAEAEPEDAKAILAGDIKIEPRKRRPAETGETLADRKGFKNLPNRALADKVAASLLVLETHIEFLETVNPERLNGERESLTERLCKAARLLNRTRTAWRGEEK